MNQVYSVWLLPQPQTADVIDGFIDNLGERFDTPKFAAHATLCSGTWQGDDATLVAAVDTLASQSTSLVTNTNDIRFINSRFQFFYLSLAVDGLRDLQALAQQKLPGSRLPEVGPHLSLIYSDNLHGIDRRQLTEELQPQMPATVSFDRLALVLPEDNNWDDIAHWKIAHITNLD